MQDLMRLAKVRGWSPLYWHTQATNPAWSLYNEFCCCRRFRALPDHILRLTTLAVRSAYLAPTYQKSDFLGKSPVPARLLSAPLAW
jgi:hypothetical protein